MELSSFIANVANQFEETDPSLFSETTKFKNLDEWSSMTALTLIAMTDEEYGVKIKGEDITKADTIADLFEIVKSRM